MRFLFNGHTHITYCDGLLPAKLLLFLYFLVYIWDRWILYGITTELSISNFLNSYSPFNSSTFKIDRCMP